MILVSRLGFAVAMFATLSDAALADTSLVSIPTPRGAKQSFILIKPEKPVASVVLFAGGHGGLGLKSASAMRWGAGNFLVRSRDAFAARNLMVAVIDAPSDHRDGMNAVFRGRFGANPPVRTTIACYGGIPGSSLVEIDCIAAR